MYLLLAFLLFLLGFFLFYLAERRRQSAGLPRGRVISTDTGNWGPVTAPLYDPYLGLTGKPDYLVASGPDLIPVEVKSTRAPTIPYDSHIYQLAAYCLLVESHYDKRPPYGILHYKDRSFAIGYTFELEEMLLEVIESMRAQEGRSAIDRSHTQPARCARCGYRSQCDQRL
jgi:CRISPR-associated exonuclease Cas4